MKAGKNHQEKEEDEDEEFAVGFDATPSTNRTQDGKNGDKANATRSKHSVTEQRRRSKINERYQILRGLIPHSDQKRDTASFLLEVIQYVQFLQEKVQKYEGSYQTWNLEPTKLMPWRNSHWHVQNLVGQSQSMKNASSPGSTFPGRFDESNAATMSSLQQNPVEPGVHCGSVEPETQHANKMMAIPLHLQPNIPVPISKDAAFSHMLNGPPPDGPSTECPSTGGSMNRQDELAIDGGTISISSVYSQELLNSLSQALDTTGLDLSQSTISVQINLGKRVDRNSITGVTPKDHGISMGTLQEGSSSEDLGVAQKRQKT